MENEVKRIIELVGGKENISSYTHCATRLRLRLNDSSLANTEAIKQLKGVITVVESGGQYQIVVGQHVAQLYDEMARHLGDKLEGQKPEKQSFFGGFLDLTTAIFSPTIKALAAGGILKGVLALLVALSVLKEKSGTYVILYAAANAIFYYYPVLLGYTSAKKFKLDPFIGLAIGAAFVYPSIIAAVGGDALYTLLQGTLLQSKVTLEFMGLPVVLVNYSSSVIPVIITVYIGSKINKIGEKYIPQLLARIILPTIVLALAVPLGLIIIGPIVTWGGNAVGFVITKLFEINNVITSAVLGFAWQPLVMLGLHKGLLPISINNFATYGYDYIYPVSSIAAYATAGALLAIYVKAKEKSTKDLSITTFFQAIIASITEPAIYGLTIPLSKPFIATNIASAIAGVVLGIFNVKSYFMSTGSFLGIGSYIDPNGTLGSSFWGMIIAWVVAIIAGFVITFIMGFDESNLNVGVSANQGVDNDKIDDTIYSPIAGELIAINDVDDVVFSSKSMGDGVAFIPHDGTLVAPVDGVVTFVYEKGHAVGITSDSGIEVLMHIGLDSSHVSNLFTIKTAVGTHVAKGETLIEFDRKALKEKAKSDVVVMVVVNSNDYVDIFKEEPDTIKAQDVVMHLIRK